MDKKPVLLTADEERALRKIINKKIYQESRRYKETKITSEKIVIKFD